MEASLPFNVALGALALRHGTLPPAAWGDLEDAQPPGGLDHVLVTGVGHWRGESVARLDRVEEGGRDG
jgi:3-oxoacyl-[acyl-carrier-protein] synthase II